MSVGIIELHAMARQLLSKTQPGPPLDPLARAFVMFGVCASVTCLDKGAVADARGRAEALGASQDQLSEILALISGLGLHSLMATMPGLIGGAMPHGPDPGEPLDSGRQEAWDRYVGDSSYWTNFEEEFPGFLNALLRISPSLFRGFHVFSAIAWETRTVPALTKELIAMGCDASPSHRFAPGFRLHLRNALKLGAGRQQIEDALEIAASSPAHSGIA